MTFLTVIDVRTVLILRNLLISSIYFQNPAYRLARYLFFHAGAFVAICASSGANPLSGKQPCCAVTSIGVQIVGSWQAESTILHVVSLLEQLSPMRSLHPNL